jgi:hypothetical protein
MTKQTPSTQIEHAAASAVEVISLAAGKATTAIADAALQATKLLATQAAEANKVMTTQNNKDGNDHDLLLRVDTKLDLLTTTVNNLQDGTAKRISTLETEKLNVNDSYPMLYKAAVDKAIADHEIRLGKLETFNTRVTLMLSGGIFALTFLIGLIVYHIMGSN